MEACRVGQVWLLIEMVSCALLLHDYILAVKVSAPLLCIVPPDTTALTGCCVKTELGIATEVAVKVGVGGGCECEFELQCAFGAAG